MATVSFKYIRKCRIQLNYSLNCPFTCISSLCRNLKPVINDIPVNSIAFHICVKNLLFPFPLHSKCRILDTKYYWAFQKKVLTRLRNTLRLIVVKKIILIKQRITKLKNISCTTKHHVL